MEIDRGQFLWILGALFVLFLQLGWILAELRTANSKLQSIIEWLRTIHDKGR